MAGAKNAALTLTMLLAVTAPRLGYAQAVGQTGDLSLVDLLDTEVVSASGSEQSLARAPAVIEVISRSELQARGYRSVGEALQSVAGIDVTSDHFQSSVGVRGVSSGLRGYSRIVKVMIDGQPVSFRPSGENFLGIELLPLGVVERLEIIRGPGSALYGANAFLGVINIITRRDYGLDGNSLTLGYEGGPKLASPFGEAVVAQQLDDFSILLGAAEETRTLDGYRLVPLPGRPAAASLPVDATSQTLPLPSSSAFGRITYDREHFGTLALDGNFQRLYRSAEFSDWGVLNHGNRLKLQNGYARLAYTNEVGEALSFSLSAALSGGGVGQDDRLDIAPRSPPGVERRLAYRGRDLAGVVNYHLSSSSWVSLGFDTTWDEQTPLTHYAVGSQGALKLNPPARADTLDRDFRNLGAYANTTLYPLSWRGSGALSSLGLTAGARFDAHNIYGDAWNGRAGLVYDIAQRHFAKLLYGTSFRAPSSTQLFSNVIIPGGAVGNPNLRPERARTVELVLGTSPLDYLTLRVDGYLTRISDRVEVRRPSAAGEFENAAPLNSSPITSRGLEAQVDYQNRFLRGYVSYSLQSSSYPQTDILAIEPSEVRVHTAGYPTQQLKGGVSVTGQRCHLRAYVEGRYVSARLGDLDNNSLVNPLSSLTTRYSLPGYTVFDLAISTVALEPWRGHETVLLGKVSNLFNASYTLPGYAGFDIPGFERSFALSLRQEL